MPPRGLRDAAGRELPGRGGVGPRKTDRATVEGLDVEVRLRHAPRLQRPRVLLRRLHQAVAA